MPICKPCQKANDEIVWRDDISWKHMVKLHSQCKGCPCQHAAKGTLINWEKVRGGFDPPQST